MSEQNLYNYLAALEQAESTLSQPRDVIQVALVDVLEIAPIDLLNRDLSGLAIAELLKDYAFPTFTQKVVLDCTTLPQGMNSGPTLLLEQKITPGNEVWFIHKYDQDCHPSNPHAHNYERNIKLHLGTGDVYKQIKKKKKIPSGNIGCDRLIEIRKLISLSEEELPLLSEKCKG